MRSVNKIRCPLCIAYSVSPLTRDCYYHNVGRASFRNFLKGGGGGQNLSIENLWGAKIQVPTSNSHKCMGVNGEAL